jgi:GNAT superfamily N-acetyltransferase
MQERIKIEALQESSIEDLINVCSSKRLNDPVHQQGISIKRQWLRQMLTQRGTCAKIAYYEGRPVAQILYYPEEADPAKVFRRENVLALECIYNPTTEAQKLGVGTRLLKSTIQDAKQRKTCLGNKPCKFIAAKAFNTGEFLPLPDFYKKNGFLSAPSGDQLYLPIEGNYEPTPSAGEYEPLPEDRNKAIVFYGPVCQYSFQFAKRTEAIIKEVAPNLEVELINEWEEPEESIKRKNSWLTVNAKPIHTFFMETENFKQEIKQAMS